MAKRRRQTEEAEEPKEEAPIVGRESFLPEPPAPEAPIIVKTPMPDSGGTDVSLTIAKTSERNVEISLVIPPLAPCVEKVFLPMNISSEQYAAIVAAAIKRAASSAESDGIFQHARRVSEDSLSEKEFSRR